MYCVMSYGFMFVCCSCLCLFVCVRLSKMCFFRGACVMYCVRLYAGFVVCAVLVCVCVGAFLVLM